MIGKFGHQMADDELNTMYAGGAVDWPKLREAVIGRRSVTLDYLARDDGPSPHQGEPHE